MGGRCSLLLAVSGGGSGGGGGGSWVLFDLERMLKKTGLSRNRLSAIYNNDRRRRLLLPIIITAH